MANTYNVYLRKRLTEFDIIIRNLPYRDELTVYTKMYLDAMLNYLCVQKFIIGSHDIELQAKIDDLLKRVMNVFHNYSTLNLEVETFATKPIGGRSCAFLDSELVINEESFNTFTNFITLSTKVLQYDISKSLGDGHIEMVLSTQAARTLKTAFEKYYNDMPLKNHVNSSSEKFTNGEIVTMLSINKVGLFNLLDIQCETYFSLLCASDIELWYTLGSGNSTFCLTTHIGDLKTENFFTVDEVTTLLSEVNTSLTYFVNLSSSAFNLFGHIEAGLKRYRKIVEVDPLLISDIENFSVKDLDFVVMA